MNTCTRCDALCEDNGNCCLDYEAFCDQNNENTESVQEDIDLTDDKGDLDGLVDGQQGEDDDQQDRGDGQEGNQEDDQEDRDGKNDVKDQRVEWGEGSGFDEDDEENGEDDERWETLVANCTSTCRTNSEEASPVKNACCVFPFFFDADDDGEVEEHNTCIEVAEGAWCSTHVDQDGLFQEDR